MTLEGVKKNQIELALRRFGGNRAKTAEALGISISTLHRRLEEMGSRPRVGEKLDADLRRGTRMS
jgi:DNA-binding NtrC family response regulator